MFRKKIRIAGMLLLGAVCARAQEWTEQSVLGLFERQNPIQREARAAVAAAAEELRGRTLWPNPTLSYSRETVGFTEFFDAQQQIPLAGRLGLLKKAIAPATESAEAQGAARSWDVRSSIRVAFYRALGAQNRARALESSLTELQEILELLRVREREGEGSRYDRMRVEREAAEMRADLAVIRAGARSDLGILLSYLPPQTEIGNVTGSLSPPMIALSKDDVIRQALDRRAELRVETSRLAQLSFEQQAAERLRFPEPVVTAGLKRADLFTNQTGNGAVIGVSVPLPIFNKGKTEVARLSVERDRTQARRDLLAQQISALVAGAYDVYAARSAALRAFEEETSDAGAELLRVARAGYQEGELGILQLLDAYRLARQTALRRLELELAVKETEIELSRSAGFEVTQ